MIESTDSILLVPPPGEEAGVRRWRELEAPPGTESAESSSPQRRPVARLKPHSLARRSLAQLFGQEEMVSSTGQPIVVGRAVLKVSTDGSFESMAAAVPLTWFAQALEHDRKANYVAALNIIFRWVDEMLCSGRFASVNEWLAREVNPESLSTSTIIGILSITRPAARELSRRQAFRDNAWQVLAARGKSPEKLIGRL
jgi:hypothetical protein